MSGTVQLEGGWILTTEHAASSYGVPVLVSPDGEAYGKGDIVADDDGNLLSAADVAAEMAERAGLLEHAMLRAFLGAV